MAEATFSHRRTSGKPYSYIRTAHLPILIQYPDNNEVLENVSKETYELCRRVDPFRLNIPICSCAATFRVSIRL